MFWHSHNYFDIYICVLYVCSNLLNSELSPSRGPSPISKNLSIIHVYCCALRCELLSHVVVKLLNLIPSYYFSRHRRQQQQHQHQQLTPQLTPQHQQREESPPPGSTPRSSSPSSSMDNRKVIYISQSEKPANQAVNQRIMEIRGVSNFSQKKTLLNFKNILLMQYIQQEIGSSPPIFFVRADS
jgi:hypothetical protein